MLELTSDWSYDAVGGLTLGADPVAAAMLHAAAARGGRLDAFVVRKAGKAHGLQRRIEGPDVAGRRVLAVEDTSTTGGSVLTAVEALQEAGAAVVGVAVIVDRGLGKRSRRRACPTWPPSRRPTSTSPDVYRVVTVNGHRPGAGGVRLPGCSGKRSTVPPTGHELSDVPAARRFSQATSTRAAIPASAALPYDRGS